MPQKFIPSDYYQHAHLFEYRQKLEQSTTANLNSKKFQYDFRNNFQHVSFVRFDSASKNLENERIEKRAPFLRTSEKLARLQD